MARLEVRDLRAHYGRVAALHGIALDVGDHEFVAILGANGSGKTTLLRAITRMVRTDGELRFDGASLAGLSTDGVARCGVGHVPEGRGTFTDLTVAENLRLGALGRGKRLRDRVAADLESVYEMFPLLAERQHQAAGNLSGGQQQMLAVGRALLARPKLLLLDEPSLGLAPTVTAQIFQQLVALRETWDLSLLMAEQNAALTLKIADRAYLFSGGRVALAGTAAELADHRLVRDAYFGGDAEEAVR